MRPRGAVAVLALGALALVAVAADLIASDLPLAVRVDGRLHLVPCLVRPAALAGDDQQSLARRAAWMLPTPIPYGPLAGNPGGVTALLQPPSRTHLAGTDDRGRDVAARLVHGAHTALVVGGAAVLLFVLFGVACGLACAASPVLDLVLGRLVEIGLIFPSYFLLLCVQGALALRGPPSLLSVAAAIALTRWPQVARVVRAEALRQVASPHVEAARAIGAGPLAIARRHVLPLAAGPVLVAAAFGFGQAVLLEAGLSFLGLGVPPPTPSWGELLAEAHANGLPLQLWIGPALAIAGTVYWTNRLADDYRR